MNSRSLLLLTILYAGACSTAPEAPRAPAPIGRAAQAGEPVLISMDIGGVT